MDNSRLNQKQVSCQYKLTNYSDWKGGDKYLRLKWDKFVNLLTSLWTYQNYEYIVNPKKRIDILYPLCFKTMNILICQPIQILETKAES